VHHRYLLLKLYKKYTIFISSYTADATDKDKLYSTCSMPELIELNFYDGPERILHRH